MLWKCWHPDPIRYTLLCSLISSPAPPGADLDKFRASGLRYHPPAKTRCGKERLYLVPQRPQTGARQKPALFAVAEAAVATLPDGTVRSRLPVESRGVAPSRIWCREGRCFDRRLRPAGTDDHAQVLTKSSLSPDAAPAQSAGVRLQQRAVSPRNSGIGTSLKKYVDSEQI